MSTRHWQITLQKDGRNVTLFTTTTGLMIDLDLDAEGSKSLILMARQYHRHPPSEEQNHRDLAIGAIMTHAAEPPYDRTGARVLNADAVPDASPINHVGSSGSLVPIWEEAEEDLE